VGSELPFSRLVKAADDWAAQHPDVAFAAQIGKLSAADYEPLHFGYLDTIEPAEYSHLAAQADLLVAHAGMGSIITALTLGKPIVIMPRRERYRETRNDHQVGTAERFGARSGVFVAWDETEFDAAVTGAIEFADGSELAGGSRFADGPMLNKLRAFIRES
jgi:UDP-N-acetylglucosamine transferase subunit ALG13